MVPLQELGSKFCKMHFPKYDMINVKYIFHCKIALQNGFLNGWTVQNSFFSSMDGTK